MSDVVIAIVGPTSVGKSALALDVAERLGAEIVNADSMQGYIGMNIGTAKPTLDQRLRVRHHVIDLWVPSEEISVVEFRDAARTAIEDIHQRGRIPLVVGGSWLYVQAIVDQMEFPPTDPLVRRRWQNELDRVGVHRLHEVLREADPQAAEHIDPRNGRRIVRALEVVELTGSFTARLPEPASWCTTVWWGVDAPRDVLDHSIRCRVAQMWDAGFIEEVRTVRDQGLGRTAGKALGYEQIGRFLDGDTTEDAAFDDTVQATVKFARRQQRRFRQDQRISWLDPQSPREDAHARIDQLILT